MSESDESAVWKGRPSQVVNLPTFAACILIGGACIVVGANLSWYIALGAVAALLLAIWKWLVVHCKVYEVTSERLRMYEGVLNQDIDEIELYRVKDSRILRPFWLRLFGLGNVHLETSDRTHPEAIIYAVKDAVDVRELLRKRVEALRDKKRVREIDFDETGDSEFGDEIG